MKKFLVTLGLAALFGIGSAFAQVPSIPKVTNVGTLDLFQDIQNGNPQAPSIYATAAQIAGVPGYKALGTISTDPAYTFTNGVTDLFAHAAGTLTLATLTTEPNPADGKRECWYLDQTTTTLTWTANTGQTINASVPAAGVAKNPNCITYVASSQTWFASP